MRWREWLGVGERRWKKAPEEEVQPAKTLWDWLQLLIVPAILIGVTFAWSATQTRSDNKREDRRIAADRAAAEEARQDATLQTYLDQMSGLMLREKLLTSKNGSAVRSVARTVTLATLRRLDGSRKGEVVHFLFEAQLLDIEDPRVVVSGADLAGANLVGAYLPGANLEGANLGRAHLEGANLADAYLPGAYLAGAYLAGANRSGSAHLERAFLTDANLEGANLEGVSLGEAILEGVTLAGANFADAYLAGVNLAEATLVGANFEGANFTSANLEETHLEGAKNLDLGRFITDLPPGGQKVFLDSQKAFLDSLSPDELAKFNLSPEKLARFRRQASGG